MITTSAKNMISALEKNKKWFFSRYGANSKGGEGSDLSFAKTIRRNCKTASFLYKK